MNREARRRGGGFPPSQPHHHHLNGTEGQRQGGNHHQNAGGGNHGGYGNGNQHHRGPSGPDAPGRWERDRHDRHYGNPPPRDWRGPQPRHRDDEDDYRGTRAIRSSRGRSRSRSRSIRSGSSRSSQSISTRSSGRSRSRSPRRTRDGGDANGGGSHHHERVERKASDTDRGSRSRSHDGRSASQRSHRSGSHRSDEQSKRHSGKRSRSSTRESPNDNRRRRRRSYTPESSSDASSSSSSSSKSTSGDETDKKLAISTFSKDQRTVFITQLVMRATEKEIRRYFRRKVGCKVNEVILLKDKRTGRHKGCAYVEVGRIEDVLKAVTVSGQPPDFQRFPILVKASEAEKNYVLPSSSSTVTAKMMGTSATESPFLTSTGHLVEAQKVYVGSLDPSVTEQHLFAIFQQFGNLEKVSMQMDPTTGATRGYAFLSFRDPKEANLAIQSMSNQILAGRPMKTGWANQSSSIPGVEIKTSDELPEDSAARTHKAFSVLSQLTASSSNPPSVLATSSASLSIPVEEALNIAMGVMSEGASSGGHSGMAVPTVADARASLAAATVASQMMTQPHINSVAVPDGLPVVGAVAGPVVEDAMIVKGAENPTKNILVHNMFDKDEETDEGWEEEIKNEFEDEASNYGKLIGVTVMSKEVGGKIHATFEEEQAALACARKLAGRWFDKRQLRVEFIQDSETPTAFSPSTSEEQ